PEGPFDPLRAWERNRRGQPAELTGKIRYAELAGHRVEDFARASKAHTEKHQTLQPGPRLARGECGSGKRDNPDITTTFQKLCFRSLASDSIRPRIPGTHRT